MISGGVLLFLFFITMAFWLLIFLAIFVPYMATLLILDQVSPALADKLAGSIEEEETVNKL